MHQLHIVPESALILGNIKMSKMMPLPWGFHCQVGKTNQFDLIYNIDRNQYLKSYFTNISIAICQNVNSKFAI